MITLRSATVVDAGQTAVVRTLADGTIWRRAARALGGRAQAPPRALRTGDLVRLTGPATIGRHRDWRVRIGDDGLPTLRTAGDRPAELTLHAAPTGAGVLVRVDCRLPDAAPMAIRLRRRALALGEMLLGIVALAAREPLVVVAGALVAEGTVLAARKGDSGPEAGRWELPGGKVEQGESERSALARELREELGIQVRVDGRIGPDVDLPDGYVLRAYRVITDGDPVPAEHAELRRLAATELTTVAWLPADQRLLPTLSTLLDGAAQIGRNSRS